MTEETIGKKNNRTGWFMGAVLVFVLLVAATFMGGKLMAQDEAALSGYDTAQPIIPQSDGSQIVQAPLMEMAPELPARAPETKGLLVGRTDDTLTVGTGTVSAMISMDPNAVPEFSYDGIKQDVLVTNKTRLYIDRTEYAFGQTAVEQKLEQVDNLDVLTENAMLDVWGERTGDRIVAEVILMRLSER